MQLNDSSEGVLLEFARIDVMPLDAVLVAHFWIARLVNSIPLSLTMQKGFFLDLDKHVQFLRRARAWYACVDQQAEVLTATFIYWL